MGGVVGWCTGQALTKAGGRDLLFTPDLEGNTCLLVAAKEGHVEVVKVPASNRTRRPPASLSPHPLLTLPRHLSSFLPNLVYFHLVVCLFRERGWCCGVGRR